MNFQQLLDGVEVLSRTGEAEICAVEYDSRRVRPGSLFVAIKGDTSDGNQYIDAAIANGAVAVVTETNFVPRSPIATAMVSQARRALARISANFYHRPAEKLAIAGITGTNGKSTTAYLLESILGAGGRKSALVGTIEYHIAGRVTPAPHTTPESLELNRIFAEAVGNGAKEAVMEVSSHALAQERVFGVPFDVAVFTNLTLDHLDYHRTVEEYFAAKQRLFEGCGTEPPRVAVLNIEDEYGAKLLKTSKRTGSQVVTYGIGRGDFKARDVEITQRGTRFRLVSPERDAAAVFSPLIGRVNVYNILAAAAAASARGVELETIVEGIAALTRVPGRFEVVDCGQPFTVVVDYAHTDDALRNLTALAREFVSQGRKDRVITLFGCGGDRDRAKRPLMGEAAGRGSNFVVLTSDNPRSEDPLRIINDALSGLQRTGTPYHMEPDRRKAMEAAIQQARPGDIVLLAGKGHEKVQVTQAGAAPFDDVEVARGILVSMGYDGEPISSPKAARSSH